MSETEQHPKMKKDDFLLKQIKLRLPELKTLYDEVNTHWGYEDPIYRFYHHSFKVYSVQSATLEIVGHFREILEAVRVEMNIQPPAEGAPRYDLRIYENFTHLATDFETIIKSGTGVKFELEHNGRWLEVTRPMIDAFLHTRFMLEMIVKYGTELEHAVSFLPSGWATVLYLFNMR